MKRKVFITALLSLLIVSLVGCGHVEQTTVLNADGSGTIEIVEAFLELDEDVNGGTTTSIKSTTLDSLELVESEEFELEKEDGLYKGTKSIYEFDSILDIEGITMENKEGTVYLEVANLENYDSDNITLDMNQLEGMHLVYTITVPGEVINTNASNTSNKTVAWDLTEINSGDALFVEYRKINDEIIEDEIIEEDEMTEEEIISEEIGLREALALQELGVLRGTDKGLELEKTLTRAEGTAMIKRIKDIIEEAKEVEDIEEELAEDFKEDDVPEINEEDLIEETTKDEAEKEEGNIEDELTKEITIEDDEITETDDVEIEEIMDVEEFAEEYIQPIEEVINIEPVWDDVPAWAVEEVFELGRSGIVKGISETKFGPNNEMKATEFTTMLLRILGFNDSDGDLAWNQSLEKAVEIELLTMEEKAIIEEEPFTRSQMAIIANNAIMLVK